jgi:hypothetical protein
VMAITMPARTNTRMSACITIQWRGIERIP